MRKFVITLIALLQSSAWAATPEKTFCSAQRVKPSQVESVIRENIALMTRFIEASDIKSDPVGLEEGRYCSQLIADLMLKEVSSEETYLKILGEIKDQAKTHLHSMAELLITLQKRWNRYYLGKYELEICQNVSKYDFGFGAAFVFASALNALRWVKPFKEFATYLSFTKKMLLGTAILGMDVPASRKTLYRRLPGEDWVPPPPAAIVDLGAPGPGTDLVDADSKHIKEDLISIGSGIVASEFALWLFKGAPIWVVKRLALPWAVASIVLTPINSDSDEEKDLTDALYELENARSDRDKLKGVQHVIEAGMAFAGKRAFEQKTHLPSKKVQAFAKNEMDGVSNISQEIDSQLRISNHAYALSADELLLDLGLYIQALSRKQNARFLQVSAEELIGNAINQSILGRSCK